MAHLLDELKGSAQCRRNLESDPRCMKFAYVGSFSRNKNSSGDEIANVNFYAVCPEATGIR